MTSWQFWADRGGTFTDVVGYCSDGYLSVTKVLSDKSSNSRPPPPASSNSRPTDTEYCDAMRGMRALLGLPPSAPFPSTFVESVKVGTTIGTNALLERSGCKVVFITTKGFADLLIIRHQTRPDIFSVDIQRPPPLYHRVIEVDERVLSTGEVLFDLDDQEMNRLFEQLKRIKREEPDVESCTIALMHSYQFGEHERRLGEICRKAGFNRVYLSHETEPIPKLIPRAETTVVDGYLTPLLARYVDRLTGEMGIGTSSNSRPTDMQAGDSQPKLLFMKSDGGLAEASFFRGRDSLLSGPAGGVVGAWKISQAKGFRNVISFDMGGTSTDVSLLQGGFTQRLETDVGGITLCRPGVAVHTVAAGGGSILKFEGNRLLVGPQSAGAFPGPACYGQGGPLTVTDCNVLLGRVQAEAFPKVFGPDRNSPLNVEVVQHLFGDLQSLIINSYVVGRQTELSSSTVPLEDSSVPNATVPACSVPTPAPAVPMWMQTVEGIAERFLEIAVRQMATAVKQITTHKGIFIEDHVLCSFGGAGGQHACQLAELLGLSSIIIHPLASVLSAVGIGMADITRAKQASVQRELSDQELQKDLLIMSSLAENVSRELHMQQVPLESQTLQIRLRLGYRDTDTVLVVAYHTEPADEFFDRTAGKGMAEILQGLSVDTKYVSENVPTPALQTGRSAASLREEFLSRHQTEFGFCMEGTHPVDIISIEVLGTSPSNSRPANSSNSRPANSSGRNVDALDLEIRILGNSDAEKSSSGGECGMSVGGSRKIVPLLKLWDLPTSGTVAGPALIIDPIGTNVVLPGWTASWDNQRCLILTRTDTSEIVSSSHHRPSTLSTPDPFWLELFNHYFRSVAEEMGVILQHTSQSINIKERLDFSCAVFDADGQLIANAPHIPVHLGSMGQSVKALLAEKKNERGEERGGGLVSGDVYASNNPYNGGTHLPDITIITPVFTTPDPLTCVTPDLLGFVASRGHHADIGGITPGSMPSTSRLLSEEGIVFDNFLIVDGVSGTFRSAQVWDRLTSSQWPARQPLLNVGDLKAQIAANQRGVDSLRKGVETFGKETVISYMKHVLDGGELSMREVLASLKLPSGRRFENSFTCPMDGGACIQVRMQLDQEKREISVDFTGTSPTDPFNFNAPQSIVRAAVLYVFRTLIKDPSVPLNDGCFRPIRLTVPKDSVINPRTGAAVAAGNVEVSQCIVNALFGCLGTLAASQGTMNNLTFGNGHQQYYETLCGGAGAGPSFSGCSAIHTHMTNSRITDPELFESRLPVVVRQFSIRPGTGGIGKWSGGAGAIRALVFRDQFDVTILSGQRQVEPFGLEGGGSGKVGVNQYLKNINRSESGKTDDSMENLRQQIRAVDRLLMSDTVPVMSEVRELKGRDQLSVDIGDAVIIRTPGGGGFGTPV